MRLGEIALIAALAFSCTRAEGTRLTRQQDARVVVPQDPGAAAMPDAKASRFVDVAAFDCQKNEQFPGDAPLSGPIRMGAGIRAWHGGGPYGANWNVDELRCVVRAVTRCNQGKVSLTMRVGQHVVAERETRVSAGGASFEVVLPSKAWQRGFDEETKGQTKKLPFKTAAFRALVAIDCASPQRVNAREWHYTSATDEDVFVAGFATGD